MLATEVIVQLHQKVTAESDAVSFSQLYVAFLPMLLQFSQSIIKNKEFLMFILMYFIYRIISIGKGSITLNCNRYTILGKSCIIHRF